MVGYSFRNKVIVLETESGTRYPFVYCFLGREWQCVWGRSWGRICRFRKVADGNLWTAESNCGGGSCYCKRQIAPTYCKIEAFGVGSWRHMRVF